MALIGRRNQLPFVREATPGFYLDGGSHGEILLPGRYLTHRPKPGALVDVFVYRDSEDRLVATTESAYAAVGEFALLRVVSVNPRIGVFLDWGLEKDLLLPLREQSAPLRAGEWVVVRVALDPRTERLIASTRLDRYLNLAPPAYAVDAAVSVIVIGETPLGYNAVVNHAHRGLLYHSELPGPLTIGQPLDAFVRRVRPDGKIATGRLPLHDNSPPEEIRAAFGVSKKAFKQAIGVLFKAQRIVIEKTGIRLAAPTSDRRSPAK
jgi:predicted RNA-binding protein (virulence factor B family)